MLMARSGRPDADRLFENVTSEADIIYKALPSGFR
jgi:hypothetical protein